MFKRKFEIKEQIEGLFFILEIIMWPWISLLNSVNNIRLILVQSISRCLEKNSLDAVDRVNWTEGKRKRGFEKDYACVRLTAKEKRQRKTFYTPWFTCVTNRESLNELVKCNQKWWRTNTTSEKKRRRKDFYRKRM